MQSLNHIPATDSGLYLLTLRVDSALKARVGALGFLEFCPGYYVYCGSARRGLTARLRRHAARRKKKRWHIDYLTCRREVRLETATVFPVGELTECELNERVVGLPNAAGVRGFGCSDCGCSSHLTFVGNKLPNLNLEKDGWNVTR